MGVLNVSLLCVVLYWDPLASLEVMLVFKDLRSTKQEMPQIPQDIGMLGGGESKQANTHTHNKKKEKKAKLSTITHKFTYF